MAVSIRLSRAGRVHLPYYHIRVYDSRTRRDGRPIEEIGFFDPESKKETVRIDLERVKHWLSVGAKPSASVATLLKEKGFKSSDWTARKKAPAVAAADKAKAPAKKKAAAKTAPKKPRKARTASSKARGEKKAKAS